MSISRSRRRCGDVTVAQRAHVVKRVEGRNRARAGDGVLVGAERDAGDLELRTIVPLEQAGDEGGRRAPVEVRRQIGDAQLVVRCAPARRRNGVETGRDAIADIMARAGELLRQRAVIVQQRGRRDGRRAVAHVDFDLVRDLGGPRPVAQPGHAQGEAIEDRGQRRPQHQRPLVAFERGGEVAEPHQRIAAVAMRAGVVGRERERRIEALERLLVLPDRVERDAAVDEHAHAGGRECQRTVIALQRFGVALERQQRVTPVVEGARIGGPDARARGRGRSSASAGRPSPCSATPRLSSAAASSGRSGMARASATSASG